MQIHQIQREHRNKSHRQIGRGGKRGKTSGRGHKGQKARAGHRIFPAIRKEMGRWPKLRGRGKNSLTSIQAKPAAINVAALDSAFENGAEVTPAALVENGLVSKHGGTEPAVKILGDGSISTSLTVRGCSVSASAREKIEAAGGTLQDGAAA